MDQILFLTDEERQVLQKVMQHGPGGSQRIVNQYQRPRADEVTEYSPDTYIVRTPSGGITPLIYVGTGTIFPGGINPSLGTGTGTGSNVGYLDSPGGVDCPVFRILYTNKNVPVFRPLGFKVKVVNLSPTPIGADLFIPVRRDKLGTWLADYSGSVGHGGQPLGIPDSFCWASNICDTKKSAKKYSRLGTGTGSVQVIDSITVETTCLDITTGDMTTNCNNPGINDCCPVLFCDCCGRKAPNPFNPDLPPGCSYPPILCVQLFNGTGVLQCFNGFHFCLFGGGFNYGVGAVWQNDCFIPFCLISPVGTPYSTPCPQGCVLMSVGLQCPYGFAGQHWKLSFSHSCNPFNPAGGANDEWFLHSDNVTVDCGPPLKLTGVMTAFDGVTGDYSHLETINFQITEGACPQGCNPSGQDGRLYVPCCPGAMSRVATAVASGTNIFAGTYSMYWGGFVSSDCRSAVYGWQTKYLDTPNNTRVGTLHACRDFLSHFNWSLDWPIDYRTCLGGPPTWVLTSFTCGPPTQLTFTMTPSIPPSFPLCPAGASGTVTITIPAG